MTKKDIANRFAPANSEFRYEMYPFYWVAKLNNHYTQLMEKKLKPLGLTITGWRVCLILRQNGTQSISEISAHSAVKLSTVTRTVYALKDKGLLSVRPRTNDARVSEVTITKAGIKVINKAVDATSKIIEQTFAGMPKKDIQQLNELMASMYDHLNGQ